MKALLLLLALAAQDPDEKTFMGSMGKTAAALREKVAPSVVAIDVDRGKDPDGKVKEGGASRGYYERPAGPTSGTILTADGEILTSQFNVSGEIRKIVVTLPDGRKLDAKLVGYDRGKDIALLKIDAKNLPVLPAAKADDVKQGDLAAVIGRSPDPGNPTVNIGIISAINRFHDSCVQTDAELNYGNVGGPLVNVRGERIGVAVRIAPKNPWGQSGGVGFALKNSEIDKIIDKLRKGEKIEKEPKPYIGITAAPKAPREGVMVKEVLAGSPAQAAGIQEKDVITALDGKKVETVDELRAEIAKHKVGDKVKLKILRGDKFEERDVEVEIGDDPRQ